MTNETNSVAALFEECKLQTLARGRCSQTVRCFSCGRASFDAKPCTCGHDIFCAGHRTCGDCRGAHLAVGRFLKSLLETRFPERSNSRRGRLLETLQDAANEVAKTDALPAHRRFARRIDRIAPNYPDWLFAQDLRAAFEGVLITRKFSDALDASANRAMISILVMNGLLKK